MTDRKILHCICNGCGMLWKQMSTTIQTFAEPQPYQYDCPRCGTSSDARVVKTEEVPNEVENAVRPL